MTSNSNSVVSSLRMQGGRPRTIFTGLAAVLPAMGSAGTLAAQNREPIVFETGVGALSAVTIYVRDQERARRWYSERLGFEVRTDVWYAGGERVLAVAPPGQESPLIFLEVAVTGRPSGTPSPVGAQSGWVFEAADLVDTYARLRDLDVRFSEPPRETVDGWRATFVDLYGNQWGLWQPGGS